MCSALQYAAQASGSSASSAHENSIDCSSALGSARKRDLRNLLPSSAGTTFGGTSTHTTFLSWKFFNHPQSVMPSCCINVSQAGMPATSAAPMRPKKQANRIRKLTITFLKLHLPVHKSQQPGHAECLSQHTAGDFSASSSCSSIESGRGEGIFLTGPGRRKLQYHNLMFEQR